MQGKTMERLGATLARSAKVAGVAAALLFSAPGTGEHASAAAASVDGDWWEVRMGTWVLCLPIPCLIGSPYCCDMFAPPGPMM
ncbi:MAG: hypothetical protein OXU74_14095 [Gemmatimonadota bacterium]|nr:hypothetical protein [Gemmatimonadota bacterium]